MNKEEIKRTVPNIPGVYLLINKDSSSYIGYTTKLKKTLLSCSEEYFIYNVLYSVDSEYENKETLYKELKSFIIDYINKYPNTIPLNSINTENKKEEIIKQDKSDWVKCKDLIENYEYLSISPRFLSIIIGVKEENILKSLKDKTLVNNRFIVTKFISDEER